MQVEELRDLVVKTLDDMKASHIKILDVRGKTSITDIMIIASGTSSRHVKALAETVAFQAKEAGEKPLGVEGANEGEWALIDLNGVVVHVMQPKVRDFYQLERLWEMDIPRQAGLPPNLKLDRFDRIFALHQLLSSHRNPVSRQLIEQKLECSRATAKRIVENMRDYLNAPIEYDRARNGYYYARSSEYGEMYELPGVWFNASELHALLSVQLLLEEMQPGLLEQQLAPLKNQIEALLKAQHSGADQISRRIRILRAASRPPGEFFQTVAGALAQRQRLAVTYFKRGEAQLSEREISPQRLLHYRDNWYLEAWCHLRAGLRTFALDSIRDARMLETAAEEIGAQSLHDYSAATYGIFAGNAERTAVLRFRPERARWVAAEQWHPNQQSHWLGDGRYELKIPYSQTPELVMDILKYGPDVEVVEPKALRELVGERLRLAAKVYSG